MKNKQIETLQYVIERYVNIIVSRKNSNKSIVNPVHF